jgi:hypothetical protein
MITNYNDRVMTGITEADYETLLCHLGEQLTGAARRGGFPADEAGKAACDALTNEWIETKTARQWLADAGKRLDVDTSDCVGV